MIPRDPPIAPVPPDDPTEFDRVAEPGKRWAGPRDFALRTQGTHGPGGASRVITPEDTRSAAP